METVVVEETLGADAGYGCFEEFRSFCDGDIRPKLAITKSDHEFVPGQVAQAKVMRLILVVANFRLAKCSACIYHALGRDAVGADTLDSDAATIFGASELEGFGLDLQLSGEEGDGFHSVLVLLVEREVKVVAAEIAPLVLVGLRLGFSSIAIAVRRSTMPIRLFGRGSYEHSSIFLGSGFETRLENTTDILVDRCTHPAIDDSCRSDRAVLFSASVGRVDDAVVQSQYVVNCLGVKVGREYLSILSRKLEHHQRGLTLHCIQTYLGSLCFVRLLPRIGLPVIGR